jgi:hypothetical protein
VAFSTKEDPVPSIRLHDLLGKTNGLVCTACMTPSVNADGTLAAYISLDGESNALRNVVLRDLTTGQTNLVNINLDGSGPGNGICSSPAISYDGRYVVFASLAGDLVAHDTNGTWDVFGRDLVLGKTLLVSRSAWHEGSGDGPSKQAFLAADGRTVVFNSFASDLIEGDYNGKEDVFVFRLGGPDTDGDGLDDDWEMAYFDTLDRDGSGDFDGDGETAGEEFRAGTDPTNAASILRVMTLTVPGGGATQLFWSAVPGKIYRVQFKDDIGNAGWTALDGDVTAVGTTATKTDTTASGNGHRYYRVALVDP